MIPIPELGIEVEDIDDFNDQAGECLTGFCEALQSRGGCRPVTEFDSVDDDVEWLWTNESTNLIEAEIARLYAIGEKYFGFENISLDISSHMYQEIE